MEIFDTFSLERAVTAALQDANVPAGHTKAFALVATPDGGVKAVLSTKLGDVWEVDAVFNAGKSGAIDAGVAVKATW